MAVQAYLLEHRVHNISWRTALNDHSSTRPKVHGGPVVSSVKNCKEFAAPGLASAEWRCTLTLPNSFAAGDGRRVEVTGKGASKNEASEIACLRAVASLISESPKDFLLRPGHWKVSPDQLVANLPGADAGHQALPARAPSRLRGAGEEAGTLDAGARMVALLQQCLDAHGGEFDPSQISRNKMGFKPEDERVYHKFNRLLVPGGLKTFIESHPDFTWRPKGKTGTVIAWAQGARQLALDNVPPEDDARAPGFASASAKEQEEWRWTPKEQDEWWSWTPKEKEDWWSSQNASATAAAVGSSFEVATPGFASASAAAVASGASATHSTGEWLKANNPYYANVEWRSWQNARASAATVGTAAGAPPPHEDFMKMLSDGRQLRRPLEGNPWDELS
ncbi:unnamed protein product [Prorocentrum cordatum]|uniref:DRBM domain-containing protein n=1 Tax=Prorocentrum cordatum TaxID=2364126 RepID=A0ABN9Y0A1_9DINO|nr:unnamed protein product [Polarella glacialis]